MHPKWFERLSHCLGVERPYILQNFKNFRRKAEQSIFMSKSLVEVLNQITF
jgi:hypothetical protein